MDKWIRQILSLIRLMQRGLEGELDISYPEQTIVFLEEIQGKTLFPSLISSFIGLLITTTIIDLIVWQFDFLYKTILSVLQEVR